MRETHVLDSFAVLALLRQEAGKDEVAKVMRQALEGEVTLLMSWANVGEVACIVERRWGVPRVQTVLGALESTASLSFQLKGTRLLPRQASRPDTRSPLQVPSQPLLLKLPGAP